MYFFLCAGVAPLYLRLSFHGKLLALWRIAQLATAEKSIVVFVFLLLLGLSRASSGKYVVSSHRGAFRYLDHHVATSVDKIVLPPPSFAFPGLFGTSNENYHQLEIESSSTCCLAVILTAQSIDDVPWRPAILTNTN